MSWDAGLNEQQREAIACQDSNVATIAGPGTGKTRTLLHKALQLIDEEVARPNEIRIVNFTRAGVFDLRRKIVTEAEYARLDPTMATTFHSLALRILLRMNSPAVPSPLVVLDEWEEKMFIDELAKRELALTDVRKARKLREDYNSRWCLASEAADEWLSEGQRRSYEAVYRLAKELLGFTTQGELTFLWWRYLRANPDRPHEEIGFPWKYLLTDEYQDLNECEHDILYLLAQSGVRIFAVGDPNQSIYEIMRHAHPNLCWEFPDRVTPGRLFVLERSYRCPRSVLRFGHALFEEPEGVPNPELAEEEGEAEIISFPSDDGETSGITRLSAAILKANPNSRILVAVPTRAVAAAFRKAMADHLPVEDRTRREIDSPDECRLTHALLRLLKEPRDSVAAATAIILNCGRTTRSERVRELLAQARSDGVRVSTYLDGHGALAGSLGRARQRACDLLRALKESSEPLHLLQVETGCDAVGSEDIDRAEETLEQVLAGTEQLVPGRVTIMTLHASKGTEAEWVFIPAAEPGMLERDAVGAAKEDRRRLLYVGMTRALRGLYVSFALRRYGPDRYRDPIGPASRKGPSVFLDEICDRTGYAIVPGGRFLRTKLAELGSNKS